MEGGETDGYGKGALEGLTRKAQRPSELEFSHLRRESNPSLMLDEVFGSHNRITQDVVRCWVWKLEGGTASSLS